MYIPSAGNEIDAKIIREIIASTHTAIIGQLLVLLFGVVLFWSYVPTDILMGWTLLHLLNYAFRWKNLRDYRRALDEMADSRRIDTLFRRYIASLLLTSALWTTMVFFGDYLPSEYHFLIYTIVVTLTYGSTMSIGPVTPIFLAFVLPMNAALAVELFTHDGFVYRASALFLIVILLFSVKAAKMHMLDYTALLVRETEADHLRRFFEERANRDALSGLPNRSRFFELFKRLVETSREKRSPFALLFIDIDRFKDINDTYGHAAGDKVIEITGKRLVSTVREQDIVARLSGDEFVMVLNGIDDKEQIAKIAAKLSAAFREPVAFEESRISVSLSIGIARHPHDATDAKTLLSYADQAMYAAKKSGRDFLFFDELSDDAGMSRSPRK